MPPPPPPSEQLGFGSPHVSFFRRRVTEIPHRRVPSYHVLTQRIFTCILLFCELVVLRCCVCDLVVIRCALSSCLGFCLFVCIDTVCGSWPHQAIVFFPESAVPYWHSSCVLEGPADGADDVHGLRGQAPPPFSRRQPSNELRICSVLEHLQLPPCFRGRLTFVRRLVQAPGELSASGKRRRPMLFTWDCAYRHIATVSFRVQLYLGFSNADW